MSEHNCDHPYIYCTLCAVQQAERTRSRVDHFTLVEKELAAARVELASIVEVVCRVLGATTDPVTKNELAHYAGWNTKGLRHGLEILETARTTHKDFEAIRQGALNIGCEEVEVCLGCGKSPCPSDCPAGSCKRLKNTRAEKADRLAIAIAQAVMSACIDGLLEHERLGHLRMLAREYHAAIEHADKGVCSKE